MKHSVEPGLSYTYYMFNLLRFKMITEKKYNHSAVQTHQLTTEE